MSDLIDRPPDVERPRGTPGAAQSIAVEATTEAYRTAARALGHYLAQPGTFRRRRELRAVARLSLAAHAATFQAHTRGCHLNGSDLAQRLRSIADDFDSLGMHIVRTGGTAGTAPARRSGAA